MAMLIAAAAAFSFVSDYASLLLRATRFRLLLRAGDATPLFSLPLRVYAAAAAISPCCRRRCFSL